MCEAGRVSVRSRSWKWAIPLAVLVLLAAAGGGVLARQVYRAEAESAPHNPGAGPQGSSGLVRFSQAAAEHPDRDVVSDLLERYFTAINHRDYAGWKSTVTPEKWEELPPDKWDEEYASTRDKGVRVHRVETGANGILRVQLSFTSHQDPNDAPPQLPQSCVRWWVVYPLVPEDDGLRINTSGLPGSALVGRC